MMVRQEVQHLKLVQVENYTHFNDQPLTFTLSRLTKINMDDKTSRVEGYGINQDG